MIKNELVSVIVATKNEERNIENCLKSIKEQSYPNIEIIVVDNNSNDKTKEIAKKHTKKVYNWPKKNDFAKIKNYRGAQLNFGVKKSAGNLIFMPDADMTFDKCIVEEAVRLLKKADALYAPEIIASKGNLGKIRNFERSFYNETCIDAVRFFRKKDFLKAKGFDEKKIIFGPDDWDFTKMLKKINCRFSITKNRIYHHEEELNVRTYIEKKKKYGGSFEGYILKWGKDDNDIKKQLGVYYRFFGVFIENGKWKKLIGHPLLAVGMYFLRIMVGINFLRRKINEV